MHTLACSYCQEYSHSPHSVCILLCSGPQNLDKFSKAYGFPVGMATLADEVGIDVAYHVAQFLLNEFGVRSVWGLDWR